MDFFGFPVWTVLLICGGVFCASFMDAIGGGGGIISVPTYLLAGLPVHFALGTNKLSSCIGTVASTVRYVKNGCVDWILAIPSIVLAMLGAHIGTRLQLALDERYLKYMLLVVLPVIAVILLKKKSLPEQRGMINEWLRKMIVWGSSLIIGTYDGFYGPGTGTFLLLSFCYLAKVDVRTASGNVKLVNLSSNLAALATSLAAGKVLIPIGLLAAVFSTAGQYIGAGLALKNGSKIVRPVILVVLLLLTGKVLLELLGIM
ncbi:MAG: sulfite exporter TauE/SafE family protein [Oscillospiraceae bacterium]|nr:sulfite exporter TauE/SafE family protein [Oscillospiraceae bacterium]